MFKRNKSQAFRGNGEGLLSYVLLQEGDFPDTKLAITWVDVKPGSGQTPHKHFPEQVYVIIKGKGRIRVGNEEEEVGKGDLVYIPSNVVHGIKNISDKELTYISASTPTFNIKSFYESGKLSRSLEE
jgi:mannose-6-phosphate isomerase-like protein (cupin superfamily)